MILNPHTNINNSTMNIIQHQEQHG